MRDTHHFQFVENLGRHHEQNLRVLLSGCLVSEAIQNQSCIQFLDQLGKPIRVLVARVTESQFGNNLGWIEIRLKLVCLLPIKRDFDLVKNLKIGSLRNGCRQGVSNHYNIACVDLLSFFLFLFTLCFCV